MQLFNTITNKKITVLGFAFKKNTGDTRASPAISLVKDFRSERAQISIYDPKVPEAQIYADVTDHTVAGDMEVAKKQITVCKSAMDACIGAEGIVVATEWDEFKDLDWQAIYDSMQKPAFVFDGRLILDQRKLEKIGFQVRCIGRGQQLL